MPVGIVMEGGALTIALEQELQDALMELCKLCRAVVCCRVSPMQKAQVLRAGLLPVTWQLGLLAVLSANLQ